MNASDEPFRETHITIDIDSSSDLQVARNWASQNSLKWTEIKLAQGRHPLQPMVTFLDQGTLQQQLERSDHIKHALTDMGFRVVRVKVESALADMQLADSRQYFESHIKIHIQSAADRDAAIKIACEHSAHLSRNARRSLDDGTQERFLTLRRYQGTGKEAAKSTSALCDSLRNAGLMILEIETEFVEFDSNLNWDAGWERSDV